jgi:hypothetical protein
LQFEPAAVKRAVAEQRGSRVLGGYNTFANPTADRRWGFCFYELNATQPQTNANSFQRREEIYPCPSVFIRG